MRLSTATKARHLLRASTCRNLTTSPHSNPSAVFSTCIICRLRLQAQQEQHLPQRQLQRRWQSASASPSPSTTTHSSAHPPPPPKTHYDLFPQTLPDGPPPHSQFAIDVRALRQEFLQLQAIAHPDRHSGAQKARAEGTSALINEAYKTLQNPLLRAQYLLRLGGIDVANDETAKVSDPELLMEVLEAREEIEGVEEEGELEELRQRNERKIWECEEKLESAFREDDLERAAREVVRLRYWVNIKEAVDGWEAGKPVVLVH